MYLYIFLILFSSVIFAEEYSSNEKAVNNNKDISSRIKRTIKPRAWEMYNIQDTIEELYGKNRKLIQTTNNLNIKVPTLIIPPQNIPIHITSLKNIKSITILQDEENERCLISILYPSNHVTDVEFSIKSLNKTFERHVNGIKIFVLIETENNHLFINNYIIEESGEENMEEEAYLNYAKSYTNKNKLNLHFRKNREGDTYLKFHSSHPMISYRDADKINKKVDFISHIFADVNNNKIFDFYTSEYVSRIPKFRVGLSPSDIGDILELTITDIHGNQTSKTVKFKTTGYNR